MLLLEESHWFNSKVDQFSNFPYIYIYKSQFLPVNSVKSINFVHDNLLGHWFFKKNK